MVSRVVTAAEEPKNWPAAMTILVERTRPHKFGRRDTQVIEGGDKPIKNVTLAILSSPEALEASNDLLRQLARPAATAIEPGGLEHELPGLELGSEIARVHETAWI